MRFIEPISQSEATGLVAQIYEQVELFMGGPAVARNGPFLAQSPDAELLAAFWSLAYETVLVDGRVPRADKHAIAAVVSQANECTFCVQTHAFYSGLEGDIADMGHLLGGQTAGITDERRRRLAEWAGASREPLSETLRTPPFSLEEAPEVIGTAVAFHYLDRVVTFFNGTDGVDVGDTPFSVVETLTRAAIERHREPGASLRPSGGAQLGEDLEWAAGSPHIAAAFAAFVATVEAAGAAVLEEPERACVDTAIEAWDGSEPPLGKEWVEDALAGLESEASRARARVTLMAAFAPQRVDEAAVEAFRRVSPSDRELLDAVAWGAWRAAHRIASWLAAPEAVPLG